MGIGGNIWVILSAINFLACIYHFKNPFLHYITVYYIFVKIMCLLIKKQKALFTKQCKILFIKCFIKKKSTIIYESFVVFNEI